MSYQIDQSGKIEQTERNTVIACINSQEITILLKKSEKRRLQKIFINLEMKKFFPYLTFAALVALLLKKLKPKTRIVIDKEYFGHENLIEEKINIYLEQLGEKSLSSIEWGHVGKLSKAHNLGYLVAVNKKKPDIIVNAKEIMEVILGTKKTGTA